VWQLGGKGRREGGSQEGGIHIFARGRQEGTRRKRLRKRVEERGMFIKRLPKSSRKREGLGIGGGVPPSVPIKKVRNEEKELETFPSRTPVTGLIAKGKRRGRGTPRRGKNTNKAGKVQKMAEPSEVTLRRSQGSFRKRAKKHRSKRRGMKNRSAVLPKGPAVGGETLYKHSHLPHAARHDSVGKRKWAGRGGGPKDDKADFDHLL